MASPFPAPGSAFPRGLGLANFCAALAVVQALPCRLVPLPMPRAPRTTRQRRRGSAPSPSFVTRPSRRHGEGVGLYLMVVIRTASYIAIRDTLTNMIVANQHTVMKRHL
eukprot:6205820-Pleurochrysis_carterae.AAC.1